jgi:hypothetical protein
MSEPRKLFTFEFVGLCAVAFLAVCNVSVFYNLFSYLLDPRYSAGVAGSGNRNIFTDGHGSVPRGQPIPKLVVCAAYHVTGPSAHGDERNRLFVRPFLLGTRGTANA